MRIERLTGKLVGDSPLQVRINEMFHSFGRLVQVIGGQFEMSGEIAFPQAVRSNDALGLLPAAGRQLQTSSLAGDPAFPTDL